MAPAKVGVESLRSISVTLAIESLVYWRRDRSSCTALDYVFFAPSRRGQWLSSATGQYIVDSLYQVGPEARDTVLVNLTKGPQRSDVRSALDFIVQRQFVNPDRVAVAGNSFGGIVTILAAAYLDGLYAALDFAGAAQTWSSAPLLRAAMTDAARRARVPVFFAQASNEYDVSPSRVLSAAMTAAGKAKVLKIFPAFGSSTPEGDSFGYYGGAIWGPDVAAFLSGPPRGEP